MKPSAILSGLVGLALATFANADTSSERTATVYIQPVTAEPGHSHPVPLAELRYTPSSSSPSSEAEILSYEAPELPVDAALVRVGVFSPSLKRWTSSTSVASTANFEKGFSPAIILSLDAEGNPVGAAVKGVAIDAGQTRDFGPKAVVLASEKGRQPDLNKPVVLSPEGKQMGAGGKEEEKTMFQKYWWVILLVLMMSVVSGGDEKK
ncbi:hypothetical protein F5Y17DRAFT_435396 [Xylariaceae sp. FL0594]|nr:hypothetical protein F5Y17DRAFT_435396 [Xylariaceae sp. FL0594]